MIKNSRSLHTKKQRGTEPCYISTTSNVQNYQICKSILQKNKKIKKSNRNDWQQIFQEIINVTDKVKQVYSRNNSVCNNQNVNKNTKNKINTKVTLPTKHNQHHGQSMAQWTQRKQKKQCSVYTALNDQTCNTKCHQLMNQCMKLNKQNLKLKKQKQSLRKMLYFQSKQRKHLKWQLQQQNIQKYKHNKSILLEKKDTISLAVSSKTNDIRKLSGSQAIKEINCSKNGWKKYNQSNASKESDSLLIDFQMEDASEKGKKKRRNEDGAESILTEKVGKSVSLQRGFTNLGMIKDETYGKQKKMLRNQIKQLTEEMGWINLKQ